MIFPVSSIVLTLSAQESGIFNLDRGVGGEQVCPLGVYLIVFMTSRQQNPIFSSGNL